MGLMTDDKKYYDTVLAASQKDTKSIEAQIKNLFSEDIEQKLFDNIKKAIIEFQTVQKDYGTGTDEKGKKINYNDDAFKQICNYAVTTSAILTPAIIEFTNAKLESFKNEINKIIEELKQTIASTTV